MDVINFIAGIPLFYMILAFVVGLMIGSFLNVVIYRLPVMLEHEWKHQCSEIMNLDPVAETARFNLLTPASRCPSCGHRITIAQNIPILSYLLLHGKCAACSARISPRYPVVELLTGIVSFLVVWRFGFTLEALAALFLSWTLIALSGIDLDHKLLPDSLTLLLLWTGLLISLASKPVSAETLFINPVDSIAGAVIGYLALWSVYQLFLLITGKEGMGYGDFKLLAALGAWLGYQQLPLIIFFSALVGALAGIIMIVTLGRDRQIPIPYGPYLAAAGWVALMWGSDISAYYFHIAGLA
ncbi:MAG: prepilin peptidase [Gammaproteobacteria bacterium]|nr:prepilin peptidase [Gammaproteobacteria bacterium]MCZ6715958.1 prepilin peptidase [Gammaproteobacteria bacterium]MCZ6911850.1 prepilin peptidase [Pseudomonadota bacterium]